MTGPASRFVCWDASCYSGCKCHARDASFLSTGPQSRAPASLTSPCESPTLEKVIRLAALETRFAERGARLEVAIGEGTALATLEPLPVNDPDKRRPRS
jgi:glycine cleavage system aminomethyltransferase T